MMNLRISLLIVSFISIYGCSSLPSLGDLDKVLPDKRTAYQKSKNLPSLEVPPDLTVTKGEYAADIPSDKESNSLSEFERRRALNAGGGATVLGGGELDGEQWLALQGTSVEIWPELREFWEGKDYLVDLDDAELGVLETDWKEVEGDKHRFKVFAEPGESGGTILFLSSERQELSEGEWLEAEPDIDKEKKIVRKLSLHFHGTTISSIDSVSSSSSSSSSSTVPEPIKPKAEVLEIGEGKSYLAIPQEFTRAWRDTELVIQRAGYFIQDSDQEKGTYNVLYYRPKGEEKKSLLKKLKFWGDDEDDGIPYQLSLTGVGTKTEIIVMNEDGEWETGDDAANILDTLRDMYNQL
jgi:outer membrane protein assembly factor BamC